ncbi:Bro-N domain-containing protein [Roseomonas sp. NAR14]|uniref:Bro-N domain-containing protein n=1 Tax=Roseomonas acroporae TaxID=2937791 RepID=A0A9X2BT16_9PROT|nr:Bro-N domain-containing protein [Roseomonas acroporae]MCK8784153.1 Bro-N domain-containing protein [Roseomonas acroporae]
MIRTVLLGGTAWFVAADVCRALGINVASGTTNALRPPGADEKGTHPMRTPGGEQRLGIISESGLYKLVMCFDKPEARTFQDWVTRDVLPAIRKDGAPVGTD